MSNLLFKYLFNSTDYNSGNGTTLNDTSLKDDDASLSGDVDAQWKTDSPFDADLIGTGLYGGSPYSFDTASRYFEHTLSSSFQDHSFTICIWVKPQSSNPTSKSCAFASSQTNNDSTFQIGIFNSQWKLVCDSDTSSFPINNYVNGSWAHLTVTYLYDSSLSNRVLKTYYNGSLTNTYTSSGSSGEKILSANDFKFTHYIIGSNRKLQKLFNGYVSSCRGYDRVLTATEITNIYTYNSITGASTAASAAGDPHISTLDGVHYKFNYIGAFRLFDNNHPMPNKRIVINAYSDWGDGRWSIQQYIRRIYIFCGNNELLIDTGFRGQKVTILENIGFKPVIKDLGLNWSAKNYCFNCKKRVKNTPDDLIKLQEHGINKCHTCKPMIRNTINLLLRSSKAEQYMLCITNVNRFNLQPCRAKIIPIDIPMYIQNKWSGCIVNRKYSLTALLNNIKAIHPISNPIIIDRLGPIFSVNDLPPIEEQPSLINSTFY